MSENSFNDDFENERLMVGRSAVRQLNASVARIEQSAVQRLAAETVTASNSAFGVANATTFEVKDSAVGVAAGDYIRVEESRVFILLAPRVSGNVKAVLTPPAAFALGAGFVLAKALVAVMARRSAS
jgi:uncharacterized protein (DUF169 family)